MVQHLARDCKGKTGGTVHTLHHVYQTDILDFLFRLVQEPLPICVWMLQMLLLQLDLTLKEHSVGKIALLLRLRQGSCSTDKLAILCLT